MKDEPLVLGIESTAHTFGVGVATPSRVLASADYSYQPKSGGIHPREAAEHHSRVAGRALAEALREAGVSIEDVDAVAVALGPGMGPCLRVGATLARYLAVRYAKPLVPVNHAVAHVEIARFTTGFEDPLVVYIAGGNTIITTFVEGRYRVFGETLDIPLGNCLDTFAREVGLGFPGTPKVEELAAKGSKLLELPYVVKGQDLQFSGLLTKALRLVREGERLEDVCYSLVETAYSMLVEVAERLHGRAGVRERCDDQGGGQQDKADVEARPGRRTLARWRLSQTLARSASSHH
jgi:N6-L-threonylcarbamoyladenine synthase